MFKESNFAPWTRDDEHVPIPDPNYRRLHHAYEAYQVFCDNGSHRIAWRNLALFLTDYLAHYFQCDTGLPLRHSSIRTRYLENLDIAKIGYVTIDLLYTLFHRVGFLPSNESPTAKPSKLQTTQELTRKYLSFLYDTDLHVLLVEVTTELNKRSFLSNYPTGSPIASLHAEWSPSSESDTGIIFHLGVSIAKNDIVAIALKNQALKNQDDSWRRTSVLFPRDLLRRAISARVESGARTKRQLGTSKPLPFEVSETLHLSSDRNPVSSRSGKDEGAQSTENSELETVPRTGQRHTSRLVGNEMPHVTYSYCPPDSTGSTASLEVDSALDIPKEKQVSDQLEAIVEVTEEEPSLNKKHEASFCSKYSFESHWSSDTLASLLDFYNHSLKSASMESVSRRSSIDSAELQRHGLHEMLLQSRRTLDGHNSVCSRSGISAHYSFVTAKSQSSLVTGDIQTLSTRDSIDSFVSIETTTSLDQEMSIHSPYIEMLRERNLIPEPIMEIDWSGRGQHMEYKIEEREQIPLQVENVLGQTRNALVEAVRCKRVRLVRKTMRCTKWTGFKREDALREVQHLYRVQHSHIVRLVGTYVIGIDVAILTYPCAEWNLEAFMQTTYTAMNPEERSKSLQRFYTCLAKVLEFMHSFPLKHMDIKPQNLLVRDIRNSPVNGSETYKIYFTDFGISRAYPSIQESETETPTPFTRTYSAIEVVHQEPRGLSADVFSLGCVYAEMLAVILDVSNISPRNDSETDPRMHWNSLQLARGRNESGLRAYYLAVEETRTWLSGLPIQEPELHSVREWTAQMLDSDPSRRPSVRQIAGDPRLPFTCLSCTLRTGPEDFEAAELFSP